MNTFIPFIHTPVRKKEVESEPLPLYIEMYPPMEKPSKEEEKQEERVITIELW